MKRFLWLLLAVPLMAHGATFGTRNIEKKFQGTLTLVVKWDDTNTRDVSGATGTLVVYSAPPVKGVGGTVLFTKTVAPKQGGPDNHMTCRLTQTDTATPGEYYAELDIVEGDNHDTLHGKIVIEGR